MGDDRSEPTRDPMDPDEPASSRGWKIAAAVAVVAAVGSVAVLGVLLFANTGSTAADGDVKACIIDPAARDFTKSGRAKAKHTRPKDCPPPGAAMQDGLVQKTSSGGFTMRKIEGGELGDVVKLHVRAPDKPYIDIAHAQTHAALGQPIRVYTLEIDGRPSVVYMEDAPLLK